MVFKYTLERVKIISNKFFLKTKAGFVKVLSKTSQLKQSFTTSLLNIKIHFNVIWKVTMDIIYTFEALLDTVASRYQQLLQKITSQSRSTRNKILTILKNEVKKIVYGTLESMEKYHIIQEVRHFYYAVKDWLKSNDMKEKVKSVFKTLER